MLKLLRVKQVVALTGLSRATIYRLERKGRFPTRRKLSLNSVAWRDSDVRAWMTSRPAILSAPVPATAPERPGERRMSTAPASRAWTRPAARKRPAG